MLREKQTFRCFVLVGLTCAASCGKTKDPLPEPGSEAPSSQTEPATAKFSWPSRIDLLSTAQGIVAGDLRQVSASARLVEIVTLTARENAMFADTGNTYVHYPTPEPSFFCLDQGSCFESMTAYQTSRQEQTYRVPRVDPASVTLDDEALLQPTAIDREATRIVDKLKREVRRLYPPSGTGAIPVWLLDTGHAAEAARARAVELFKKRVPNAAEFIRVPISEHAEVAKLAGKRLSNATIVESTFGKDIHSYDQLVELVGVNAPIHPANRTYPKLRMFDAHTHAAGAGSIERLIEIMNRNGIEVAVVAGLPTGVKYEGLEENNQYILKAARKHRGRLLAFPMMNPHDENAVKRLRGYVKQGARGVKLISGHDAYWVASDRKAIDPKPLREMLAYCDQHKIPILWHVNTHLFRRGFLRALRDFPNVTMINPHFAGYLTYAPSIMRRLLTEHKNLYIDISFGTNPLYVRRSLEDLSFRKKEWQELLAEFPDRFLFATDMVMGAGTTLGHGKMVHSFYRNMLESKIYDFLFYSDQGYSEILQASHNRRGLSGLELSEEILQAIYWDNAARLYGLPARAKR